MIGISEVQQVLTAARCGDAYPFDDDLWNHAFKGSGLDPEQVGGLVWILADKEYAEGMIANLQAAGYMAAHGGSSVVGAAVFAWEKDLPAARTLEALAEWLDA